LNIPDTAVRRQIASAIDLVIQVTRLSDGTRKVTNLAEITGMEGDVVTMQDIFIYRKKGIKDNGEVVGSFQPVGIRPKFSERLAVSGIALPSSMFDVPMGR
jgi:pilus assembly protein CpaF